MGTKLGTTGNNHAIGKDMAYPPGLELHGRTWRVTKRVPLDLRQKFPQHYPKSLLRYNTGETDKKLAAVKAWAWLGDTEEEFQRVRDTGTPHKRLLPDAAAELIIRKAIHSTLSADEAIRAEGLDEHMFERLNGWTEEARQREQEVIARGHLSSDAIELVQEWLYGHGYELDPESPEFRQFAVKFFRRLSEATKIASKRSEGEWIDTPPPPAPPSSVTHTAVPKLSAVIEYFIGKQNPDEPMFKKYRPALGLFVEFVGDKPVDQLKQKEIDDYFAFLCKLPPRWSDEKRKRGVSVRELAEMKWPKCISKKTFDDGYMAAFRPFLVDTVRVFQDQGFPGHLTTQRIKYSGEREETENEQRAMRQDELVRLFMGPEYQQFATDPALRHQYWLPLVGLYTGARINEICQLNPQCDIQEEKGVWYFDITEKSEADERVKKSVKNTPSRRKVPIHSELIRLGLLDYVDTLKASGARLLFPEWPPSASGRAAGLAERWFRSLIRETGLRDETPGARLVGFHAFRHTFLNNAMNNDVMYAEWITGHASELVSKIVAKYRGEAEIVKKSQIVEAIRFDIRPSLPSWVTSS